MPEKWNTSLCTSVQYVFGEIVTEWTYQPGDGEAERAQRSENSPLTSDCPPKCKSACPYVLHSPGAPAPTRTYVCSREDGACYLSNTAGEGKEEEGGRQSGVTVKRSEDAITHRLISPPIRPCFSRRGCFRALPIVPCRARVARTHARTHARRRDTILAFCKACGELITPPCYESAGDIAYMLHDIIIDA